MPRTVLSLAVLFLAACASDRAEVSSAPAPADIEPAALADGLSVRYVSATLNSIHELTEWLKYTQGEDGEPLETLTYHMDKGSVLTSGQQDLVGAHISGYLHFDQPGAYRFQVTTNDGVRIQLGGALLHEDPKVGFDRTSEPVPVEMSKPGWYALEIWYFEKKGTATLDILWSRPGRGHFESITAEVLKHD